MRKVQLRDAKAALSAVVDDAVRGNASVITRHGKPAAVILGWLSGSRRPAPLFRSNAAARIAGGLSNLARRLGRAPGFADIAIAATAKVHDLTVLTRYLRDFTPLGVAAQDPFAAH